MIAITNITPYPPRKCRGFLETPGIPATRVNAPAPIPDLPGSPAPFRQSSILTCPDSDEEDHFMAQFGGFLISVVLIAVSSTSLADEKSEVAIDVHQDYLDFRIGKDLVTR